MPASPGAVALIRAAAIPVAVLPLILCVLPTYRILVMALDGTVIFKRLKRRQLHPVTRPAESQYR